jgi:hypothetical protein
MEPELLKQANWLINLSRMLQGHIRDRNAQIEQAFAHGFQGMHFAAMKGAIGLQVSVANAECIATFQLIEQVSKIAQTLERIGRLYKDVGTVKAFRPSEDLKRASGGLGAIVTLIRAMTQESHDATSGQKNPAD